MNPKHAENMNLNGAIGTCTTIAMQMLLGYHNYFSDRRLIPAITSDNVRFLSKYYGDISKHPYISSGTDMYLGVEEIGTENSVYLELFNLSSSQTIFAVKDAGNKFITKYAPSIEENVSLYAGIFNEDDAKSEIDAGRPIVLGFGGIKNLDLSYHVIVAYGYANLDGEFGFIVHYGWFGDMSYAWVPSSWIGYYIMMTVNHTHKFTSYENRYTCTECGYFRPIFKFDITNDNKTRILGLAGRIEISDLEIPSTINGKTVTEIGNAAFANQTELREITIPATVTSIGANAFQGCTKIGTITIPASVRNIGSSAFANCKNLLGITFEEDSQLTSIGNSAFMVAHYLFLLKCLQA